MHVLQEAPPTAGTYPLLQIIQAEELQMLQFDIRQTEQPLVGPEAK